MGTAERVEEETRINYFPRVFKQQVLSIEPHRGARVWFLKNPERCLPTLASHELQLVFQESAPRLSVFSDSSSFYVPTLSSCLRLQSSEVAASHSSIP